MGAFALAFLFSVGAWLEAASWGCCVGGQAEVAGADWVGWFLRLLCGGVLAGGW